MQIQRRHNANRLIVPDGIPVIVPQDLFDRVQEKLAKNKKAPARHKAEDDYLLTTKLFCGYCGAYLCGESGTSRTGVVHHYYKCVSVKKKRTECHKKPVKKDWIEDLVVSKTMKMVMDDAAIEAIVSMLMDLQERANVNVPLYKQQLRETETAINNLLNAIQQGILTRSTKERLEELEDHRDDLETKLACEKLAKPKVSAEFMTFWLHRFRKLDARQKSHRKMLIDTFINAIFLYDDKLVITFNYKEGAKAITFDDLQDVINQKRGSDLDCSAAPLKNRLLTSGRHARVVSFDGKACFFVQNRDRFAGSRFCFSNLAVDSSCSETAKRKPRICVASFLMLGHKAATSPFTARPYRVSIIPIPLFQISGCGCGIHKANDNAVQGRRHSSSLDYTMNPEAPPNRSRIRDSFRWRIHCPDS